MDSLAGELEYMLKQELELPMTNADWQPVIRYNTDTETYRLVTQKEYDDLVLVSHAYTDLCIEMGRQFAQYNHLTNQLHK